MRILLLDDHRLFRSGLRLVLERGLPGVEIAEAGDADAAMAACAQQAPNVVIADIHLPGGIDGIETVQRIGSRHPGVKTVFLSSDSDQEIVGRALKAGARGYILKENAPQDLIRAVEAAVEGGIFLCPEVAAAVIDGFCEKKTAPAQPAVHLSEREREVLRLLAEGLRTKEIAGRLGLSAKSVETYRARLMGKLGLTSIVELVRYAIREGMVKA